MDYKYLLFSSEKNTPKSTTAYLDLDTGQIYSVAKDNIGHISPSLLKLLRFLLENEGTQCTVDLISEYLSCPKDSVRKRIFDLRRYIELFGYNYDASNIIASGIDSYIFNLSGIFKLSNDLIFTKTTDDFITDHNLAIEQKHIEALADEATSDSKAGRHADALRKRKEVFSWRSTHYGSEHPDTIRAMANLATSYNKLGMYQEALDLRRQVHDFRIKNCCSSDDIRKAKKNLAATLSMMGGEENLREAEQLRNEVTELVKLQAEETI